jgi:hypothetical protein
MEPRFDFTVCAGEALLLCPRCHDTTSYLHHGAVRVYERREDSPTAIRTTVADEELYRDLACPDVGTGRRHSLEIAFTCEQCDLDAWLVVYQHKGQTFITWRGE